jgi:hypothetical protein
LVETLSPYVENFRSELARVGARYAVTLFTKDQEEMWGEDLIRVDWEERWGRRKKNEKRRVPSTSNTSHNDTRK